MLPVDQTRFLSKGERGNCLAACLASIFETDLSNVPALELLPRGLWRDSLHSWSESQGYEVTKSNANEYGNNYYIAVGQSTHGNRHATVGFAGEIVHDPDESSKGLVNVEYLFTFKKIPY